MADARPCTAVEGCAEPAAVQWSRTCDGCKDVAAQHAEQAAAHVQQAEAAAQRLTEIEASAPPADADPEAKRLFYVAAQRHIEAASRELLTHADLATRASIHADAHATIHTHPVFACIEHSSEQDV